MTPFYSLEKLFTPSSFCVQVVHAFWRLVEALHPVDWLYITFALWKVEDTFEDALCPPLFSNDLTKRSCSTKLTRVVEEVGVSKNRTGNRNRTNNRKNRNRKNRNRDNNRKNRNRKNPTETVTITAKTATAKTEPQPKPQPHRKTETAPQNLNVMRMKGEKKGLEEQFIFSLKLSNPTSLTLRKISASNLL
ncbi:hypothetical protein LXL04_039727 [Taraxacum kok-saghyz]